MIVTNEVEIKIVGRNLKYYNDLGYNCNVGDKIMVLIDHLPKNSRVLIDYKCDYCNTLYRHGYNVYYKSVSTNGKKACNNCKQNKIEETNLERYNCKRPLQNKKVYNKLIETNINKYGESHANKLKINKNKLSKKHKNKYIDKLNDLNLGKIIGYNNFNTYDIICNKCNKLYSVNGTFISNRLYVNKTPCYHCLPLNKTNAELEIYNYIKNIYDGKIIINSRKIIKPYELDIYIPEFNLAFEFNGLYWHSELYKDKNYH